MTTQTRHAFCAYPCHLSFRNEANLKPKVSGQTRDSDVTSREQLYFRATPGIYFYTWFSYFLVNKFSFRKFMFFEETTHQSQAWTGAHLTADIQPNLAKKYIKTSTDSLWILLRYYLHFPRFGFSGNPKASVLPLWRLTVLSSSQMLHVDSQQVSKQSHIYIWGQGRHSSELPQQLLSSVSWVMDDASASHCCRGVGEGQLCVGKNSTSRQRLAYKSAKLCSFTVLFLKH